MNQKDGWVDIVNTLLEEGMTELPERSSKTILPDSGARHTYNTGAQRDNREGKGRYDLISPHMMRRLAVRLEQGAIKYSERNWEKGMNLSRYMDATLRHAFQMLDGDKSEDHAAAVAFNIMAFIHTEDEIQAGRLPSELNDLPR